MALTPCPSPAAGEGGFDISPCIVMKIRKLTLNGAKIKGNLQASLEPLSKSIKAHAGKR